MEIICQVCKKVREEYINGICEECSEKMDKWIQGEEE